MFENAIKICPLCSSKKTVPIEKIYKQEITALYKDLLNIDITRLIKEDLEYILCKDCDLRFFSPLITGDEAFYNALQTYDWYYMQEKAEFEFARKHIRPRDSVLEIGAGQGFFSKNLSAARYVGLDFSSKAKEIAAQEGILIETTLVEEYALKHLEEFDVVCSFQVLEHVSNPGSFLKAALSALKPGGVLIIGVPSESSFLAYAVNSLLNMPPHHVTRWSDKALEGIALLFNLKTLDFYHENVADYHKRWYLSTLLQTAFLGYKTIDHSLKRRVFAKVASMFTKLALKRIPNDVICMARGHTVAVAYQKTD